MKTLIPIGTKIIFKTSGEGYGREAWDHPGTIVGHGDERYVVRWDGDQYHKERAGTETQIPTWHTGLNTVDPPLPDNDDYDGCTGFGREGG
jgi:hypothetical protein